MLISQTTEPQPPDPLSQDDLYDPQPLAALLTECPSVWSALDAMARSLKARGFASSFLNLPDARGHQVYNLLARLGSGAPHVAFIGHVAPYGAEVYGEAMHGRGAWDMKGAVACFITAVWRFCESRKGGFPGTISVLLTGDDDGGAAGLLSHLTAVGESPDLCILGEPSARSVPGDVIRVVGPRAARECRQRSTERPGMSPTPLDVVSRAAREVVGHMPSFHVDGRPRDERFDRAPCPVIGLGLVDASTAHEGGSVSLADLDALTMIYTLALAGLVRTAVH